MCGIVGLFSKSTAVEERLGEHLGAMLVQLGDRGPDSAGVAVYRDPAPTGCEQGVAVLADPAVRLGRASRAELGARVRRRSPSREVRATPRASFVVDADAADGAGVAARAPPRAAGDERRRARSRSTRRRACRATSSSASRSTTSRGSHALGHTRMATESRVTTEHSHPFSTGLDLCLVHNGSLSQPQPPAPRAAPRGHRVPDRQRHRGRGRLPDLAAARGRARSSRRSRAASTTSTASTPSRSARPTASPCCATRSPASRR